MLYCFDDTSNLKSEWCRKQARLLSQLECAEDEPVRQHGLANVLQEMAKRDYSTAENATIKLMQHLLYLITAPNNYSENHWLGEIENFRELLREGLDISKKNKKGNTNFKNRLMEDWQINYKKAVAGVLKKARLAKPNTFMTSRIPPEPPWSLEDFLNKDAKELSGVNF